MLRSLLVASFVFTLIAPSFAGASSSREGVGVIWAVDLAKSTVTIGKTVYRVTSRTSLEGREGERLAMVEIPVARDQGGWLRGVSKATVQFRAVGLPGNLTLASLRLLDPPS